MNEYVLLGVAGGFIYNVLQLLELQKKRKEDRPFKDLLYWLPYLVWPILGGLLVFAYDGDMELNRIISLQTGVSAPLIFRQMVQSTHPSPDGVKLDDEKQ